MNFWRTNNKPRQSECPGKKSICILKSVLCFDGLGEQVR